MNTLILSLIGSALLTSSTYLNSQHPQTLGADFNGGIYAYRLNNKFFYTPNTIEAYIRLGKRAYGEDGGVIFGNYCKYNEGSVNLEIDSDNHVVLRWNSNELKIIFDEYTLKNDVWTYVSVARDTSNSTFNLYINGRLVQSITSYVGEEPVSSYSYVIGSDLSNWGDTKNYFHGEIKNITVYKSDLSNEEISKDYAELNEISYKNRENLLFNTTLSLNDRSLIDTSRYSNHAKRITMDYFYKGDLYEANDYSFAVIPDPQLVTNHRRDMIHHLGDYLLNNKEKQKIELAMCVGDNADCSGQWDQELGAIVSQFDRIEGKIKYTTVPGNHDYTDNCTKTRDLSWYNKYFSPERVKKYSYFGGLYKEDATENSYYLLSAGGVDYLIMCLEFGPGDAVLNWANEVVEAYPERRVIVTTHGYLDADGEFLSKNKKHSPSRYAWNGFVELNDPDEMYEKFIKKHKNMFMVLCGHIPNDDIIYREDVGDYGNVIPSFLIDGQGILTNWGCDLMVSLFNFDELNQEIKINYASTISDELYNEQNQFTYSFKGNTEILSKTYYENGKLKGEYKISKNLANPQPNFKILDILLFGALIFTSSILLIKMKGKISL